MIKKKLSLLLMLLLCAGCISTSTFTIPVMAAEIESSEAESSKAGSSQIESSETESSKAENSESESKPESSENESTEESSGSSEEEQIDIRTVSISGISDQVFNGTPCTPSVTITGLTENIDFSVTYQKNTVPGTAVAVVTGIGRYKGSVELTFEIILPQAKLTGISNTSGGVKLTWEKMTNISGYYIYRKEGSGNYEKIAAIQNASTVSYVDKNVSNGKTYIYQIKTYYKNTVGKASAEKSMKYLSQPSVNSSCVSGGVKVTWAKIVGANGYYVYRKAAGESSYKKVKTITDGSIVAWTDNGAAKDTKYLYKLDAYSGKFVSSISNTAYTVPQQPGLKSISSVSYNSIKITWSNVCGEDGYYIYRKTSGTSWKKVAEVKANTTSWIDKELTCGTSYIYTVQAFVKKDNGVLSSSYNKTGVNAKPVPAAPVLSSTTSKTTYVTVTWKKAAGATSYYIYRKIAGGSWKKLASVKSSVTSYQDKTAEYGVKYIYTVKSMRNNIAGKYNTSGIEGARQVSAITMKSICITSKGKATVKWNKTSCADGYFIYRKVAGGNWKKVGSVKANKNTWTESGLEKGKKYWYIVAGYMTLNGKNVKGVVSGSGIAPKLEYTGDFVRNVTKTYLGKSGGGRNMYSYTIGSGKNHIVITMAVHAWEDNWARDGAVLVKTGDKLIQKASEMLSTLDKYNYSIIIVPMANPDGLYSGTTCNGSGRCTVYRYNSSGKLVKGGVDLNRCFPAGFSAKYSARNYTGSKSLMAKEAVILKNFIDSSKGSGKNIFIDTHGWYNQVITRYSGTGNLYKAFKKYFPGTRGASFGRGMGYVSGYAYSLGYDSALFEFPYVSSESSFNNNNYAQKYINAVFYMVKNLK